MAMPMVVVMMSVMAVLAMVLVHTNMSSATVAATPTPRIGNGGEANGCKEQ